MVLSTTILYTGDLDSLLCKTKISILDSCKIYSTEIILGFICGFVVGAKGICNKYKQNSNKNDFNRAVFLSSNASVGFVIGCVGCVILDSILLGIILYIIQIITAFIIFKIQKNTNVNNNLNYSHNTLKNRVSNSLIKAIKSSASTMITICSFNIIFTLISDLFIKILKLKKGSLLFCTTYSLFEFSKSVFTSNFLSDTFLKGLIIGFCIGFGGLCTHFQIFAECEEYPLNRFRFFILKLVQGIFCGLFFGFICFFSKN